MTDSSEGTGGWEETLPLTLPFPLSLHGLFGFGVTECNDLESWCWA
jgi:hypothetical protein